MKKFIFPSFWLANIYEYSVLSYTLQKSVITTILDYWISIFMRTSWVTRIDSNSWLAAVFKTETVASLLQNVNFFGLRLYKSKNYSYVIGMYFVALTMGL